MVCKHLFSKFPKAKYFDSAQHLQLQMLLFVTANAEQPEFSVHLFMSSHGILWQVIKSWDCLDLKNNHLEQANSTWPVDAYTFKLLTW